MVAEAVFKKGRLFSRYLIKLSGTGAAIRICVTVEPPLKFASPRSRNKYFRPHTAISTAGGGGVEDGWMLRDVELCLWEVDAKADQDVGHQPLPNQLEERHRFSEMDTKCSDLACSDSRGITRYGSFLTTIKGGYSSIVDWLLNGTYCMIYRAFA